MKKKAILVEFSFMTRIVISEDEEDLENIVQKCKKKIAEKVENELGENLSEWYLDEEMPYKEDDPLTH
jgi:hypothetical protein